jgi:hypothetical protein
MKEGNYRVLCLEGFFVFAAALAGLLVYSSQDTDSGSAANTNDFNNENSQQGSFHSNALIVGFRLLSLPVDFRCRRLLSAERTGSLLGFACGVSRILLSFPAGVKRLPL